MENVFETIQKCCGCAVCESVCPVKAISMTEDSEGFTYSRIDQELCIDCGACRAVCAFGFGQLKNSNDYEQKVYAVKHESHDVRMNSSSGGAFTALSDSILESGGVVYGACLTDDLNVQHKRADTASARDLLRGSKYVQSNMRQIVLAVRDDLEKGLKVLYSGTPCQVDGLRAYLCRSKVNQNNLVTVDFVCHGVPNQNMFNEFINYVEKKRKRKIDNYCFRPKNRGWGHTELAVYSDGTKEQGTALLDVYRTLFHSKYMLRPCCHHCRYASLARVSDVTIADFWGIEDFHPEFADSFGVSALLLNSSKGETLFMDAAVNLADKLCTLDEFAKKQRNVRAPSPLPPLRAQFWHDYYTKGFKYIAKRYGGYSFMKRLKRIARKIVRKNR